MKRLECLLLSVIMAVVLILSGCAHSPGFKQVENIPADKAVIYIYHSGGSNHYFLPIFVLANDKDVAELKKGTYYPYVTEPGVIEFIVRAMGTSSLVLDIEAGHTYYLKGSVPSGFSSAPFLVLVSMEVGTKEIANCKLTPSHK